MLAPGAIDVTAVVIGDRRIRSEVDGLRVVRDRLVEPIEPFIGDAAIQEDERPRSSPMRD
jgi:hypothetical protein